MKKWENALVNPETSILEAVRIIDNGSLQIALVVDDNMHLLGTITDGDIRRAILSGVPMQMPVEKIMFTQPVTALVNASKEEILNLMKHKELRHVPILNDSGRVMDLKVLLDIVDTPKQDNWVVLMAGGKGSRLRPLTSECPKPMLKVGNKPVLETILTNLIEYGFNQFYISVNYRASMIEQYFNDGSKWNVEIRYLREKKTLGTAGALSLLPERPGQTLFVMNADLLTKVNYQQLHDFHVDNLSLATMCVREYGIKVPYGVVDVDQERLVAIHEKPDHRFFVNAGIYALEPEVLNLVPNDTPIDMPNLFETLIKQNNKISVFPIREYWIDIGQEDDLEKANSEFFEVFNG